MKIKVTVGGKPRPARAARPGPKQRLVIEWMRAGWRIMFGQTSRTQSIDGEAYTWGEMACLPGRDTGVRVSRRTLETLVKRELIKVVPRATPVDTSSLRAVIASQSVPHECYVLTEKGKTGPL